jgi:hypothetical protein
MTYTNAQSTMKRIKQCVKIKRGGERLDQSTYVLTRRDIIFMYVYIISSLSHFQLSCALQGNIAAVVADETPSSLWGEDKPDPKDALAKEGFQMRRVVLTPKVRNAPKQADE